MKKKRADMSPEQKLFNFMIVVRFFMPIIIAILLGGLDFTSVFPSGETVSKVNLSLKIPWIILIVIFAITVIKYYLFKLFQRLVEDDGPTMLVYNIIIGLQLIKIILWLLMLAYAIIGFVTDTVNWGILATPIMLYLFLEVFYACIFLRSDETE